MSTVIKHESEQKHYVIHYEKYLAWPAYLLFSMMLFVPTTYQPIKAVLLVVVLLIIGIRILMNGRLHIHINVLLWTLLMVFTGLAFITLGAVNNTPGALRVGTVYVLWPLVYTILLAGVDRKRIIDGIFRVLVFSLLAISLYSILYLLYVVGWLPHVLYVELDMGQATGFYDGYIEYNLYNISSLNFLVPFLITVLFVGHKRNALPVSRLWIWLACLFGIVVAILSGRRAVWVILAISPLFAIAGRVFMTRQFKSATNKKFKYIIVGMPIIIVVLFLFASYMVGLDVSKIWQQLTAGFSFSGGGASEFARLEQFLALLDGWLQNPIFGAGHGAAVAGSQRSVDMPWAYELTYVALLFHTGLVGFFIYTAGVIWIFWMGIKVMRSGHWLGVYMLPTLVGTACFLIANTTNPYLAKFDYIWVIFLPVALINVWLLDRNRVGYLQEKSCSHQ